LCSAVFCLAILLPIAAGFLHIAPAGHLAEATGSPFPAFSWDVASAKAVGKALTDGWLDRNFPFRETLIRWHNYWSSSMFGTLSPNSPVLVGKDGWLFLARDHTIKVLEEDRRGAPLTEAELERLVRDFTERQAWLARHGIKYLLVVAPNKDSIYPEFLPASHPKGSGPSRLDQVMEYMARHTTLNVVDPRPALLAAKKHTRVFYATDSHWNADGAFLCYQLIIERLSKDFPALTPMDASQFFSEEYAFLGGDLAYMAGLADLVMENKRVLIPKVPMSARGMSTGREKPGYYQPAQASAVEGKNLPRAVFFHDSYFWDMLPFLGEHFSRAVYVWVRPGEHGRSVFDKDLILEEKPDVVVEQIAERFFLHMPADDAKPAQEKAK